MLPNLSALQVGSQSAPSATTAQTWREWWDSLNADHDTEPQGPAHDFVAYEPSRPRPSRPRPSRPQPSRTQPTTEEQFKQARKAFNDVLGELEKAIRTFYDKYAAIVATKVPITKEQYKPMQQDQSNIEQLIEHGVALRTQLFGAVKRSALSDKGVRDSQYSQAARRFCYYRQSYCEPILALDADKALTDSEQLPSLELLAPPFFQCFKNSSGRRGRGRGVYPNSANAFGN